MMRAEVVRDCDPGDESSRSTSTSSVSPSSELGPSPMTWPSASSGAGSLPTVLQVPLNVGPTFSELLPARDRPRPWRP